MWNYNGDAGYQYVERTCSAGWVAYGIATDFSPMDESSLTI